MGTLPLGNLQNRRLSRVARSSNALSASSTFDIDLGKARAIGVLALVVHNLSVSATVRVLADDAADFATPIYDSGAVAMWPAGTIPQSLLEWEDDNFWLGTVSQEAVAGYQAPFIHLLSAAQTARYWRVQIADTSNPDGWINMGRLYIANTWTPTANFNFGAGIGFDDASVFEASLTGEEFFEQRKRRRKFSFSLGDLSESEGYSYALEIDRMAGTTGEVLVVADPEDATNGVKRNFLGRITSLSSLVYANYQQMSKNYEISEIL